MTTSKIFKLLIILLPLMFLPVKSIFASEPNFSFYPDGGDVVNKDEGFLVDVLIDSGGQELTSARFVVTFDPAYLKLEKAERNNALFEQWPNDESTIDNEEGVVMLTGFTQSGSGTLYKTGTKPDVMARLEFKIVKAGSTTLGWEFDNGDNLFQSVMLIDGSPPTNILMVEPDSAIFKIGAKSYTPINTAIPFDKAILVGGVILIIFGGLMVFAKPRNFTKGKGTIIVYEK